MKKHLLLIAVALSTPLSAFAWGAVYLAEPSSGPVVRAVYLADDAEDAKAMVRKACDTQFKNVPCRILGEPQVGKMVAVYLGDNGHGVGVDVDAKAAINNANQSCSKKTRNCYPGGVIHFGKPLYAAVAFSSENGYYVYTNEPSRQSAEKAVMGLCAKGSSAKACTLQKDLTTRKNIYFATASSPAGRAQIAYGPSAEKAKAKALGECETAGHKCTLVVKDLVNDGETSISAKNKTAQFQASVASALREQEINHAKLEATQPVMIPEPRVQEAPKQDWGPCIITQAPLGGEIRTPGCDR